MSDIDYTKSPQQECPECYRQVFVDPNGCMTPHSHHTGKTAGDCPGTGKMHSPIVKWAVDGVTLDESRIVGLTAFEVHTGGYYASDLHDTPEGAHAQLFGRLEIHVNMIRDRFTKHAKEQMGVLSKYSRMAQYVSDHIGQEVDLRDFRG